MSHVVGLLVGYVANLKEPKFAAVGLKYLSLLLCNATHTEASPARLRQAHSPLVPGDCWAFAGQHGQLVIALSHQIKLSHVTLGHISKSVSPTGTISSAPKEFSIFVSWVVQS